MNTSETLNRAADLIEERGWAKGASAWGERDETAPICLEGGMVAALGADISDPDLYTEFQECPACRAMSSYLGNPSYLYDFNDAEDRTASEVIEVLRACAVIEASRERESAEVSA
jgi:hypothetical protein